MMNDLDIVSVIRTEEIERSRNSEIGLFAMKPANVWIDEAKNRPIPNCLFGEFWYENELCILFADANLGKSILAVQIGDSISSGREIEGFKMNAEKQPVLYFDFELSDKQFELRYSNDYKGHYRFSDDFLRLEINSNYELPQKISYEEYVIRCVENCVIQSNVKVLIIDNLTYLRAETEKSKDASILMKQLKELKEKHNLSILVLAHTPKRDLFKPITRNDLQGSKMLINFCDSAFAIGESHNDKHVRYLKQIKARNTAIIYDADNVAVCQITKPDNFLQFQFLNFTTEQEHLKVKNSDNDSVDSRIYEAVELKKQGISNIQIAKQFAVSEATVRKWLKKYNSLETP